VRGVDARQLLDRDHEGDRVEAGTTELLAPRDAEQAELAHAFDVVPRERRIGVVLRGDRGNVFEGERAHHLAHGEMGF